jgi:hypothetical protein
MRNAQNSLLRIVGVATQRVKRAELTGEVARFIDITV